MEERFKTQVSIIWMVEIRFWARNLILLLIDSNDAFGILSPFFLYFCQEKLYNPKLYVFLMYLIVSKYYSKKDSCNPLLLITNVWTRLNPVGFSFELEGFSCKNSDVWFIFLLYEFIYLLLLVDITYLVLHKEMIEKLWCLLKYCEFTLIA